MENKADQIYREHAAPLWRALVGYCGDPELASDAASEAFAQLLARGDQVTNPVGWLWTAAFRIAAGDLKRRASRPAEEPSHTYDIPESIDHIVSALRKISPNQRLAVLLHDYADRPTDEIAEIMHITRTTVHVHLSVGRRRLRQILEDQDD